MLIIAIIIGLIVFSVILYNNKKYIEAAFIVCLIAGLSCTLGIISNNRNSNNDFVKEIYPTIQLLIQSGDDENLIYTSMYPLIEFINEYIKEHKNALSVFITGIPVDEEIVKLSILKPYNTYELNEKRPTK